MNEYEDLSGKFAVVTGGGSGIGLECVRQMVEYGASVLVVDRDSQCETRLNEIGVELVAADVSNDEEVSEIGKNLADRGLVPDILVTCAGTLQRTLPPESLSWSEWDQIMQIHLRGTYACCKTFGSMMAEQGRGALVTISSVLGIRSGPLHGYGPAKAGIIQLTKTLAAEWGPKGVRVNSVAPGFTLTPAVQRGLDDGTLDGELISNNTAMGRFVESGEVASAVRFLVGPGSTAITGIVLPVDCGYMVAADWGIFGGLRS